MKDPKCIKIEERSVYDFTKLSDSNLIVLKWHNNSIVTLVSIFYGVEPMHTVKKYSRRGKNKIQANQPHLIEICGMPTWEG